MTVSDDPAKDPAKKGVQRGGTGRFQGMTVSDDPTKDPAKKGVQRGGTGRFQPGHAGGPGRQLGSRNKATVLLDQMAEGEGQALLAQVIEAAKSGDIRAADLLLSRIWPVRKGRPVALQLPAIKTAADIVAAVGVVADAVGAGVITPDEGQAVASVLEARRRAIETTDLEIRITALEKERNK